MNKEIDLEEIEDIKQGTKSPALLNWKAVSEMNSDSSTIIGRKVFRPTEFFIERMLQITAFFSMIFIILIFTFVFREASSILSVPIEDSSVITERPETYGEEVPYDDAAINEVIINEETHDESALKTLLGMKWIPVSIHPSFGILPLLMGSINVALIALLIGAPIAVLAALYTSTFAPKKVKELVKPIVEILAGFPSVVIGFFALIVIATLIQQSFGLQYRLNAFVGGVALSLAIIPVIFTISEDALNSVPHSYVEASLALGAEKWQTALFVVLPSAMPGIFAAVLLGIGRAIGETMIVLMATGNAAIGTLNPFMPVRTMSATIGAEMAEVVFGDFHYSVLFLIGVILFVMSFLLNLIAETVVRKLVMRRYS